ncbi:spore germination protein KC [Paenibacillus taihuensis]|uniref:Spore germination protein KC n=1 Tax=Paenibacillus taihuensis TaxID=1156355 RepID=A0A3D9R330_9BACL|nr:Ger(x)C family spore germination protein [Paenibacillus taihuensis]REE69715.1 spore germination protein KC [Paenibacillus taihuensis]
MKRIKWLILLQIFFLSGCWDRMEINELALVTGTAIDLKKNGNLEVSLQVALPSSADGGHGEGKDGKFFVISVEGKNGNEIHQKLQEKSTRKLFLSHRSVVYISETLAKEGLNGVLDIFIHDPRNRLKTYLIMVKGSEAKDILQMDYPLKQVPIETVKALQISGGELAVTIRDFYIALESEGIQPVMSVIEVDNQSKSKNQLFNFMGAGVFKDLKLAGVLNEEDLLGFMWTTNKLNYGRVTAYLPDGRGEVGLIVTHASSKIITHTEQGSAKFKIMLSGQGGLVENNSTLNVSDPEEMKQIKHALEDAVKKQVQRFIAKIQKDYNTDSIGFGHEIYKKAPKQWEAMRNQWDELFPKAEIGVEVKLRINGSGMVNPTFGKYHGMVTE